MTQQYVALRGNAADNPTDQGGGNYQLTITVADDSGVYNGTDVAAGQKLIKIGSGGGQMRVYDIVSVSDVFAFVVTITVSDPDNYGNPGFGSCAVVQPNESGAFPVVAGVNQGLQQAISQFNLAIGGSIYDTDGTLTGSRSVNMDGNDLTLNGGKMLIDGLEITSATEGIITKSPDGSRWLTKVNDIGVETKTKL